MNQKNFWQNNIAQICEPNNEYLRAAIYVQLLFDMENTTQIYNNIQMRG